MKPKNLKFPFSWEERAPLLLERVLYIPQYYQGHEEWSKDSLREVFSAYPSIHIEYCSGNGTWVAEKAKENPQTLWIAVEKRFDRVQKIWSKQQNHDLNNLFIVSGDARVFVQSYLSDRSVDRVFINFPDPWPKAKHAKNRLLQSLFVGQMWRTMKPGGFVTLVTDDEVYSHQMIQEMSLENLWSPCFPEPYYVTEWEGYGSSYFDSLWRAKGKNIRYLNFVKKEL